MPVATITEIARDFEFVVVGFAGNVQIVRKRIRQPVATATAARVTPGCSEETVEFLVSALGCITHRSAMTGVGPAPIRSTPSRAVPRGQSRAVQRKRIQPSAWPI